MSTYHSSALTVADVRVEPGQATQYSPQSWDPGTVNVAVARIAGHRSQQVLHNKT